jgi:plastocyanin
VITTVAAGPLLNVSAQSGGTIEGHVKLTGTPPPNEVIKMGADPNCLKINAGKRVVQQTVVRASDGGLMNVFVNVKGSFPQVAASPAPAVIDQQGCVYHPRVQGARVGQTLEVKNSDATLHNIHSMSTKGIDFNVGQPLAGMVYKYQLKTEEVMLHVKCDVHSWMTGYIGVVSHPYFAVTDATGAFTIANAPAGMARAVRRAHADGRRQGWRHDDGRIRVYGQRETIAIADCVRRPGTRRPGRRHGGAVDGSLAAGLNGPVPGSPRSNGGVPPRDTR